MLEVRPLTVARSARAHIGFWATPASSRAPAGSRTRGVAATLIVPLLAAVLMCAPAQAKTLEGIPALGQGHVFLIIGENTDYSHLNTGNAPFLMSTARPASAWFDNYYAATHWSEANYVALATGQFTACEQHDIGIGCHQNVDNIYHQLHAAGLTWKVWLEGGVAKCDGGSGSSCSSETPCPLSGFYTTGNPPILFDDIEGPHGVWSATTPGEQCLQNDIPAGDAQDPMGTFNADLSLGNVPNFNEIIPNGCDDGEASCPPVRNRYTQFDDFLASEVPQIEASPAFGANGVIIIIYDESDRMGGLAPKNGLGQGGHTVCAVISPLVVPGDYATQIYSYSLLRTLEDGFGIPDYLGSAAAVTPIGGIWTP
jgi:hypothetical protein